MILVLEAKDPMGNKCVMEQMVHKVGLIKHIVLHLNKIGIAFPQHG